MRKSSKPCKPHKLAFGKWQEPEVQAMKEQGLRFRRCKKCKWIIRVPAMDKFWEKLE